MADDGCHTADGPGKGTVPQDGQDTRHYQVEDAQVQTAQGQDVRGTAAAEKLEDVALQEGAVAGEKGREQGSGAFMGEGQAGQ